MAALDKDGKTLKFEESPA